MESLDRQGFAGQHRFSEHQGFAVIDFHTHFPFGRWSLQAKPQIREYSKERNLRMALEWDMAERPDGSADPLALEEAAAAWAGEADKYGLDRVVFLTGGGNDNLARAVGLFPDKFIGLAHHDPASQDAADQLRIAVDELGLRGYKILAPRMTISFDDPNLKPVWEFLANRSLPVVIHFGLLGHAGGIVYHPMINPLTLANVARAYPEIPFVVPHFGCGYWQELLQLCWACPNVFIDTSGSNQWMRWMPYPLDLESAFRKAYETVGPRRIIFGTDSSWFPRGFSYRYLQDQVRVCRYLNLKQEDLEDIFAGNARRLLGI
jgi:predicted TIM-barrel fold metal-dependent hydrolase